MAERSSSSSGGIGILGMMFIVMFVGKIFEIGPVATWSWWWVTSPLWGGVLVIFGGLILFGAGWVILEIGKDLKARKTKRARRMKQLYPDK